MLLINKIPLNKQLTQVQIKAFTQANRQTLILATSLKLLGSGNKNSKKKQKQQELDEGSLYQTENKCCLFRCKRKSKQQGLLDHKKDAQNTIKKEKNQESFKKDMQDPNPTLKTLETPRNNSEDQNQILKRQESSGKIQNQALKNQESPSNIIEDQNKIINKQEIHQNINENQDLNQKPQYQDKNIEGFKIIKQLDRGKFGIIYLVESLDNLEQEANRIYVAKELLYNPRISIQQNEKLFDRETKNLCTVSKLISSNTSHITKLFQIQRNTINNRRITFLIMEYMAGGSLTKYLEKEKKLNEQKAWFLFKQLAEGLRVLYECKIIHRDLKPDNLLLDDAQNPQLLKICDLGLSKDSREELTSSTAGTYGYMCPEIMQKNG